MTSTPFFEHQHHHFHEFIVFCALHFTFLSIFLSALSILLPLVLLLLLFVAPAFVLLNHGNLEDRNNVLPVVVQRLTRAGVGNLAAVRGMGVGEFSMWCERAPADRS